MRRSLYTAAPSLLIAVLIHIRITSFQIPLRDRIFFLG
jgi:hypothetical protein